MTWTGIVGGLCVGLLAAPTSAAGHAHHPDVQLVAKGDARQLFATPKEQWYQKVRHAAASGMAMPLGQPGAKSVGMSVRADDGTVSTVLRYDIRDDRPSAVLFAVAYPARTTVFTRTSAEDVIATVKRQMAPEFHVVGHTDVVGDRFTFFFFITQSYSAPAKRYLANHAPILPGRTPIKRR